MHHWVSAYLISQGGQVSFHLILKMKHCISFLVTWRSYFVPANVNSIWFPLTSSDWSRRTPNKVPDDRFSLLLPGLKYSSNCCFELWLDPLSIFPFRRHIVKRVYLENREKVHVRVSHNPETGDQRYPKKEPLQTDKGILLTKSSLNEISEGVKDAASSVAHFFTQKLAKQSNVQVYPKIQICKFIPNTYVCMPDINWPGPYTFSSAVCFFQINLPGVWTEVHPLLRAERSLFLHPISEQRSSFLNLVMWKRRKD